MALGLAALLDDVALIAKAAASSIDDVAAAAGRTSAKAAGVVIDDAAVTPRFVQGVSPARELPIIWRIARGSLVNKLVFILPIALLLSSIAPWILTPLLMCGGAYLCFEGAEKILGKLSGGHEAAPAVSKESATDEDTLVRGAIMTDFILSAEIMVISLNEVSSEPLLMRTVVLAIVGIVVTIGVYGVVAALVKMDDVGLALTHKNSGGVQRFGHFLVKAMPVVLNIIAYVGTFAMLWVGGHILIAGMDKLFWSWPYESIHHLTEGIHAGALTWGVETFFSMVAGLIIGSVLAAIVGLIHRISRTEEH